MGSHEAILVNTASSFRFQAFTFALPAVILLALIFVVPVVYVAYFSFHGDSGPTFAGYHWVLTSPLFRRVLWTTIEISVLSTVVSVVIGYIMAYHLARLSPRKRTIGMTAVLLPFWTSILVKSYSFTIILGKDGLINRSLAWILGYNPHLPMLFDRFAVLVGMSNYLVPFVVFPVLTNLLAQDRNLIQASSVMGAHPLVVFWKVTLPLSQPAIIAGALMSLIISFGFFITPAILGGQRDVMLANLIDMFTHETLNWTTASAIAVFLLVVSLLIVGLLSRVPGAMERR